MVEEKSGWVERRDGDAKRLLEHMVRMRRSGSMRTWTVGALRDELRATELRSRERLTSALSHLYDDGLIHIEGGRVDNTTFGPSDKAM